MGALTNGERGLTTTCVCAMNAAGGFIPPMLIFKRSRMNYFLKRGVPPKYTRIQKENMIQIFLLLDSYIQKI